MCRLLNTLASVSRRPCCPSGSSSSATPSSTCPSSGGSVGKMRWFTWSYIFSASATRNFVHSVSTLFEIILYVLIGNNLSNIIFNKGETFEEEKRLKLAGTVEAAAFGLIGFAAVLVARLLSCIITTSIITRFNFNLLGNVSQNTSLLTAYAPLWGRLTQGGWQLSYWAVSGDLEPMVRTCQRFFQ